jgi:glycosyltransferase involved in cell wall biosynthesis
MEISIYGTCYNNAKIIGKCLDSIVSQFDLNRDVELVVVDNFSTDGTWEILNEYAKKYKNIKLLREPCSRGKGRKIAYDNSTSKYSFYIDFDTIYSPLLSKLINQIKSGYQGNKIMPFGFLDKDTMMKIGGWNDLNNAEDGELEARAISKGIQLCTFPARVYANEIPSTKRGLRFRKRRLSIKFFLRQYRITRDGLIGRGIKNIKVIKRAYKGKKRFLVYLVYIMLKLERKKTKSYSNFDSNAELIQRNRNLLDPKEYRIDKSYWIYAFSTRFISKEAITRIVNILFSYGFNRLEILPSDSILVYTDETSKKFVEEAINLINTL